MMSCTNLYGQKWRRRLFQVVSAVMSKKSIRMHRCKFVVQIGLFMFKYYTIIIIIIIIIYVYIYHLCWIWKVNSITEIGSWDAQCVRRHGGGQIWFLPLHWVLFCRKPFFDGNLILYKLYLNLNKCFINQLSGFKNLERQLWNGW